ncbi:serine hydrolase domain-containing protein [Paenibacillus lautus]|jgi:CubicO group peptidase (beta-lactamase class C family)|uniref:serine hydrolase domain-containing protein n=1 Tax=Paenibacillus lautus TaxID=1401 RepID=UPI0010F24954|nr:serine hydrolase domain-containing protein [Paenibacillus lautus]MBY0164137.1 beta-lactamase family protein [Cytobacillus firmus]MCI1776317.1 beta-lactamase family protein [Paenibacillus lautus]VTR28405.1 Penicillin-binding protein E [Actinobacillus pleuropneumoniae]
MLHSIIHSYLNQNQESFHGAVLVSHRGEVLYQEAFGLANREWCIPNAIDTRFRIGSVTKSITALGILKLVEAGQIQLDDRLVEYIPDFKEAEGITLTHLLNHTSGIGNITMQPDFTIQSFQRRSVDELVAWIRSLPMESELPASFSYSNSGYVLLGKIIENVTGLTYAEFLEREIFGPAGMQDSVLESSSILINRASGYEMSAGGELRNASYIDMSNAYSAGGIVSTAPDLHLLNFALDEGKLLSGDTLAKLFAWDGQQPYRYGWNRARTGANRPMAFHHGGINGYTASYLKLLDQGTAVFVLSNVSTMLTSTLAGVIISALEHEMC